VVLIQENILQQAIQDIHPQGIPPVQTHLQGDYLQEHQEPVLRKQSIQEET
jgi:hypothetical protein